MDEQAYKQLCEAMAQRGGAYPGMDIPEFYALAREMFTQEEARVCAAMPRRPSTASQIAECVGMQEQKVAQLLEAMADKGLCTTVTGAQGEMLYAAIPFVPGIFEFQFMRGTATPRDQRLARLIRDYKKAVDSRRGGAQRINFPLNRVIPVERTIQAGARLHTYEQVSAYIEKYEPISVSTCFCRHEARLIEGSDCGKPNQVCMQFGGGARYVIERKMGKEISKEEAKAVLKKAEEAGLVHASMNTQEIDFICNCCPCHCMILKTALAQPSPGMALHSGFQPRFDPDRCVGCATCVERCPAQALTMVEELPRLSESRCFGCGVCASGCVSEAIQLVERPQVQPPPLDRKALKQALSTSG
ncbi:MAG: 4Fe-4S binding protein [bacterium]